MHKGSLSTDSAAALLVAIICAPVGVVRADVSSTVAYWRFEEGTPPNAAIGANSIVDASGNGLHLTPANDPLYSNNLSPDAAAHGSTRSMEFNGSIARAGISDTAAFQLTHSLTIEAFVRSLPLQPGTGGSGMILLRGDNRPGLDPYFMTLNNGNQLVFEIVDGSNNFAAVTTTIPFDTWLHVAGTLDDATGAMKLYVNGQVVDSTTTSVRPLDVLDGGFDPGVSIGGDFTGQYGLYFHGWLDDVRLSNIALTPGQFVPEPTSAATIGLIGMSLLWRRRN